ncbi:MAG: hydroxyethylthiazole kinase [Gammaproteobacteria bacterium]
MTALDLSTLHSRLVAKAPLIQNITNTVVQEFTANVLLAIGASPAMLDHEADAGQFAGIADAILINFGTATNHQLLAADAAINVAHALNKPWVLDPVSVGVISFRTSRIRLAAACQPTAVRGNASEIMALAEMGPGGRGVDSADEVDAALPAAVRLAKSTGGVVAISGARDAVVAVFEDRVQVARIAGGHELMQRVVGTGCSLGAVTAAYLAAQRDANGIRLASDFEATIAAHTHFALAGKAAAEKASSPGSYAVAFLDSLYAFKSEDMARAQVSIETHTLAAFNSM